MCKVVSRRHGTGGVPSYYGTGPYERRGGGKHVPRVYNNYGPAGTTSTTAPRTLASCVCVCVRVFVIFLRTPLLLHHTSLLLSFSALFAGFTGEIENGKRKIKIKIWG